ncbi:hypothetical protein DFH09DRAFT_1193076 [Mycena vulgaris]|nr:hypothetical protein DFH09DRAFT_1193076 [Mycena vulgaris]
MNRTLAIPEVIGLIFDQVADDDRGWEALSHLAQTCRAFSDPALDLLWVSQESLVPILATIPDFWEDTRLDAYGEHPPVFNPECLITPGIWDRVRFYAARVKSLSLVLTHCGGTPEVLEVLSMSFPGDCLFPNLDHLSWALPHRNFPYLRLFLSPRMTSIDLELSGSATQLTLLPLLPAKCPSLMKVIIYDEGRMDLIRPHYAVAVSSMLCGLPDIRTISVGCIDPAALRHLAHLPSLTSLCIDRIDEPLWPYAAEFTFLLYPELFPSLTELRVFGARIDLCKNFIRTAFASPLKTLYVGTETSASEPEARTALAAISAECPPSLTSIDVELGQWDDVVSAAPAAYTVLPATLAPLLTFKNLLTVRVKVPFGLCLDNAFCAEMAVAWPLINELSLHRPYIIGTPSPPSAVTISALLSFARQCPDLHTLALPLSSAPPGSLSDGTPPAQMVLKYLAVIDSPIEAPFPVAAFLSSVFPGLEDISTSRDLFSNAPDEAEADDAHEAHRRWKEVERLVPLLVTVREEERRRCGK